MVWESFLVIVRLNIIHVLYPAQSPKMKPPQGVTTVRFFSSSPEALHSLSTSFPLSKSLSSQLRHHVRKCRRTAKREPTHTPKVVEGFPINRTTAQSPSQSSSQVNTTGDDNARYQSATDTAKKTGSSEHQSPREAAEERSEASNRRVSGE